MILHSNNKLQTLYQIKILHLFLPLLLPEKAKQTHQWLLWFFEPNTYINVLVGNGISSNINFILTWQRSCVWGKREWGVGRLKHIIIIIIFTGASPAYTDSERKNIVWVLQGLIIHWEEGEEDWSSIYYLFKLYSVLIPSSFSRDSHIPLHSRSPISSFVQLALCLASFPERTLFMWDARFSSSLCSKVNILLWHHMGDDRK